MLKIRSVIGFNKIEENIVNKMKKKEEENKEEKMALRDSLRYSMLEKRKLNDSVFG